jgi:signal transduction histidine kinase
VPIPPEGERQGTADAGGLPRTALVALAVCGVALTAGAVAVALRGPPSRDEAISATAHALAVAAPIGVALAALARRRSDRFAGLLLIAGFLWAAAALAQSRDELPYSIGRVAVWLGELMLVYLLLVFPSGRLRSTVDRRIVMASIALVCALYLPTALLVDNYPQPSPWTSCRADCPHNAFMLVASEPGGVEDVIRPLRELVTALVFLAVAGVLGVRARAAGPLLRRLLAPVVAVALFRAVALAAYELARRDGTVPGVVEVLGWIYTFAPAVIALSFAAGIVARRLYVRTALERLTAQLGDDAGPAETRAALAETLEDPSLQVVHRLPGEQERWVDENGWPVGLPATATRQVTEIDSHADVIGAIVSDAHLGQDAGLVRASGTFALVHLANRQLVHQLRASLHDLLESRAQLVTVADEARHRIERNLHDGAQQRLVALRVKLSEHAARLRPHDAQAAAESARFGDEVEELIDEIRELAQGIYPSLLAERGLTDALRSAARGAAIPTTVSADGVGRYPPEVESTVYFACAEALQNAAKHASGARRVRISLSADSALRFEVRDDGPGGLDGASAEHALMGIRTRVSAIGGAVTVDSWPDGGTRVAGRVPLSTGGD